MKKKLGCRAMGMKCDFLAVDEAEEEVVRRIAEHLKTAHGIEFTEDLKRKAIDRVRLVEV